MPEGDTVWRTARHLNTALAGHRLTGCDVRVPAYATVDLSGEMVDSVVSRGKHLLTRIGPATVHTHLKMEGSWHLYRPDTPWRRPAYEARIVLATQHWQAVGFALGVVEIIDRDAEATVVGHLGPDLLGADWDADVAVANLGRDPARPLGEALLDQRNLAGIGNMYRNELCFLSGTRPATAVGDVTGLDRLVDRAYRLLHANKERVEQTTTGDTRRGARMYVHGRAGQPCRRCGTTVEQGMLGELGRERVAYWCPACQR